ncbi:ABC-2 family transporter protein [Streptomyces sp. TRM75563]|uniref:ABC transporter permease n=1 Tax=Streptomyces sp. TRM75563 TaxID=2817418 RepID=UPI001F619B7D|nr:ABC-2 family transporter protein [Streptomyces sp. TRM75563]MCI4042782.1 ABC-2 family transporter protein [Streptomyces sp. TRM75563]
MSVIKVLRLTWFMCGVSLHRLAEYRGDFVLGAFGFLVMFGVQAALVGALFSLVPTIGGWGFAQVLFLLGFAMLPRGLDKMFSDNIWLVSAFEIRGGEFYRYMIRPVNPLLMVLSERLVWPDAFGELLVGLALVIYASSQLSFAVPTWEALVVGVVLVVCGALIHFAVKLLLASLAFWTTRSFSTMRAVTELSMFSGYPLDLYHPALRAMLTWMVPFAFTAYFPATYLLFGETGLVMLTPLIALVSVALALTVWRMGLRRYEATGS